MEINVNYSVHSVRVICIYTDFRNLDLLHETWMYKNYMQVTCSPLWRSSQPLCSTVSHLALRDLENVAIWKQNGRYLMFIMFPRCIVHHFAGSKMCWHCWMINFLWDYLEEVPGAVTLNFKGLLWFLNCLVGIIILFWHFFKGSTLTWEGGPEKATRGWRGFFGVLSGWSTLHTETHIK